MDFTFTPEQNEAAALAAQILGDRTTVERLREVEADGDRFDADLWRELGNSGLLSLAIPEEYDGGGLGLVELCRVLVEVGRTVAPVPLAWHGAAALALARWGTDDQRATWLPRAASGEVVLTAAVSEDRAHLPVSPGTRAEPDGDGWRISGTKTVVPAGTRADLFLVTAATPDGPAVLLVEPGDAGLEIASQRLSDGDTVARLTLTDVALPAGRLLGGAAVDPSPLHQLLVVCAAAESLGATQGGLALTADYAKTREQFGRPIGTFQAVSQRLADGYIDTLGQELTLWQAAWRVSEGLPAEAEVATAKMWAADAGHRIAHTTVHVHGGVGIDLDGEAHRFFTAAKRFEFAFGGTTEQARAVGRVLAG